jgi:hypothetical protein
LRPVKTKKKKKDLKNIQDKKGWQSSSSGKTEVLSSNPSTAEQINKTPRNAFLLCLRTPPPPLLPKESVLEFRS